VLLAAAPVVGGAAAGVDKSIPDLTVGPSVSGGTNGSSD
jgi:hypothetical protein